jgi:hypothetical protein
LPPPLPYLWFQPAPFSYRVTASELAVLAAGLAVIVVTNAALLQIMLAPLDRLA